MFIQISKNLDSDIHLNKKISKELEEINIEILYEISKKFYSYFSIKYVYCAIITKKYDNGKDDGENK